jgi:hypothetical protein
MAPLGASPLLPSWRKGCVRPGVVRDHRKLEVFRLSEDLLVDVYRVTVAFAEVLLRLSPKLGMLDLERAIALADRYGIVQGMLANIIKAISPHRPRH